MKSLDSDTCPFHLCTEGTETPITAPSHMSCGLRYVLLLCTYCVQSPRCWTFKEQGDLVSPAVVKGGRGLCFQRESEA